MSFSWRMNKEYVLHLPQEFLNGFYFKLFPYFLPSLRFRKCYWTACGGETLYWILWPVKYVWDVGCTDLCFSSCISCRLKMLNLSSRAFSQTLDVNLRFKLQVWSCNDTDWPHDGAQSLYKVRELSYSQRWVELPLMSLEKEVPHKRMSVVCGYCIWILCMSVVYWYCVWVLCMWSVCLYLSVCGMYGCVCVCEVCV